MNVAQARIKHIEAREHSLLKRLSAIIRHILRGLFAHKLFSPEIMNSNGVLFKRYAVKKVLE
jgi:hypothetical protein